MMNNKDHHWAIQEPTEELDNDIKNGLEPQVLISYNIRDKINMMGISKTLLFEEASGIKTYTPLTTITATIFHGTDNSAYKQLQSLANVLPNGPFNIHGQDGKIKIHNTKANAKTLVSYTYNGGKGELLEMSVEGNFSITVVEASKGTNIDPIDKSVKEKITQVYSPVEIVYENGLTRVDKNGQKYEHWDSQSYYHSLPNNQLSINSNLLIPQKYIDNQVRMMQRVEESYPSVQDAENHYNKTFEASTEELTKWFKQIDAHRKGEIDSKNPEDIIARYQDPSSLPDYFFETTVEIRKLVDPVEYSTLKDEESKPRIGIPYLDNNRFRGSVPTIKYNKKEHWENGYNHLKSNPNVTFIQNKAYKNGELIDILETELRKIPISGTRMLSSANMANMGTTVGNDLIKTINDKIKAKATVLGRPGLTSSINIEIKGIGSKYSGVWYVKSVKHQMSSDKYTCDLEFRKKVVPITKVVYSSKNKLNELFKEAHKLGKDGVFDKRDEEIWKTVLRFKDWRADTRAPDANYRIAVDNKKSMNIFKAEADLLVNPNINNSLRFIQKPTNNSMPTINDIIESNEGDFEE